MAWASLERTARDGRAVVVKRTEYDARLEADGLRALGDAGAPVPEVIDVDSSTLVIDEVGGPADWELVGRSLAMVHRSTSQAFGYHHDNVLGPLAQHNPWTDSWSELYAEHRLRPHLGHLPGDLPRRIDSAIESGALGDLLEHGQPPSLVHGDLWSGNVVEGRWLVDPAVHYADRELDRAFADLFGGLSADLWRAYEEEWPPDDGWRERRPALQLYHLAVHVRLFGGAYAAMVAERLDRMGW